MVDSNETLTFSLLKFEKPMTISITITCDVILYSPHIRIDKAGELPVSGKYSRFLSYLYLPRELRRDSSRSGCDDLK